MSTPVSRRPRRGKPYGQYGQNIERTNEHWNSIEEPGGRKLWIKLVLGFSLLAVFGTILLAVGAVLFQHAYDFHHEGHTALPMAMCIVSMVCGVLMFFGSIILGNVVISSKWRKNQKPNYGQANRVGASRVRYTIPADGNSPGHVEIDLPPPPYDSSGTPASQPAVFFVQGNLLVSNDMPPPQEFMLKPPEYGDISENPPSYSSLCKVHSLSAPDETQGDSNSTNNESNE